MSDENLHKLMLDALRRGILKMRGIGVMRASEAVAPSGPRKIDLCRIAGSLTHDQGLQVLIAVVRICGIEAIGAHNNGCFVDITDWDSNMIKQLNDVIQYVIK